MTKGLDQSVILIQAVILHKSIFRQFFKLVDTFKEFRL